MIHLFDLYLFECHISGYQLHAISVDRVGPVATIKFEEFTVRRDGALSCVICDGDGHLVSIGSEKEYIEGDVLQITYEVKDDDGNDSDSESV